MKALRDEKGMVLLLVLAVIALLTSLVTEFAFSTLVDLRLTETFRDSTRAWYLAKGGIEAGRKILEYDKSGVQNTGYDHRSEMWGLGVPSYPVGENGTVAITIEDLSSRVNLNYLVNPQSQGVDPETASRLYRLFTGLGFPDPADLTAALVDWIDTDGQICRSFTLDDGSTVRADGAEESYYERLPQPYKPKNKVFEGIDELGLVRGFTPETLRQVKDYLTVFGDNRVNLNTASAEVLQAMDALIDSSAAEAIIAKREDSPFKRVQEVNAITGLQNLLNSKFTVEGQAFQVTAEAAVADGRRTATAVVNRDGKKIHYLKVD